MIFAPVWKIQNFLRKIVIEFLAQCHLFFGRDILTIVTPNLANLGPLEIIHLELSRHIKLKNGPRKDLQTVAQIRNQKKDKTT